MKSGNNTENFQPVIITIQYKTITKELINDKAKERSGELISCSQGNTVSRYSQNVMNGTINIMQSINHNHDTTFRFIKHAQQSNFPCYLFSRCVHVCVRACVRVCVFVCVHVRACVCVHELCYRHANCHCTC